MKSFDSLWVELEEKIENQINGSNSAELASQGVHAIGKKVIEEAGEVWLAAEYQSNGELAAEIAQLIYHLQVLAIARGLSIEEIYKEL